jgi:hypothetical protein
MAKEDKPKPPPKPEPKQRPQKPPSDIVRNKRGPKKKK